MPIWDSETANLLCRILCPLLILAWRCLLAAACRSLRGRCSPGTLCMLESQACMRLQQGSVMEMWSSFKQTWAPSAMQLQSLYALLIQCRVCHSPASTDIRKLTLFTIQHRSACDS